MRTGGVLFQVRLIFVPWVPLNRRFDSLPGRQIAVRLVCNHFDSAGDLAAVLDLQAAATGGPKHLTAAADVQAAACGQRAVDGAGDLGFLYLDLALEYATRGDRQFGRMNHRRFDGAFDHKALGILDDTLHTYPSSDDERTALGRIARGRASDCRTRSD